MLKPKIKPGDYHIIVNDWEERFESQMRIFNSLGKLIHTRPCLAKGQMPNYRQYSGDTPPGLYYLSHLVITAPSEPARIWNAYGKYFFDMVGMEQNEEKYGRAGVGLHGGGSGAVDPLAPYQQLMPTLGCVRAYNADLEKIIYPMWLETQKIGARIYMTVHQN